MKQPHRPWNRFGRYLGRRGGILFLFGLAWMGIGLGDALIQSDRFGMDAPLNWVDRSIIPGIFWMLCGFVALINGLLRRRFHNEDAFGYAALIMPPLAWSWLYAISYIIWIATGEFGRKTSFLGVLVFGIVVIAVLVISHWRDDLDEKYVLLMHVKNAAEAKRLLEKSKIEQKRGLSG